MTLSARSLQRLVGVHPDLVKVVHRAADLSAAAFLVVEGLRTRARQVELYAKGRTTPGPKVTWSLDSRHISGHAVDLAPVNVDGVIDWLDRKAFDAIYTAMMAAAQELHVPLRSGMDWDRDGITREKGESDSPHYELPREHAD